MTVVVVANPKGGAGKSTLASNVAGFFASRGHTVALGDSDVQQSTRQWLGIRPTTVPVIQPWAVGVEEIAKPPKGISHVVVDTPAGLDGKRLKSLLRMADCLLIPVQPSIFDIFATRDFLNTLGDRPQAAKLKIALVGMRVDERTIASEHLADFVATTGYPMVGTVRDTQTYVHLAAQGLTLFDVVASKFERDLEMWQPICDWLERD
jgi:chromosome partitioning protein